jgi:hypothetical protein
VHVDAEGKRRSIHLNTLKRRSVDPGRASEETRHPHPRDFNSKRTSSRIFPFSLEDVPQTDAAKKACSVRKTLASARPSPLGLLQTPRQ